MWSIAALGLALVLSPLYVSACGSLAKISARNAHRLVATRRGTAELERLQSEATAHTFTVTELPDGRGTVSIEAGSAPTLRRATLTLTWSEDGTPARATWTTLLTTH